MDSFASTSSPPDHPPDSPFEVTQVTQPVVDRILRALGHPLRLLHRSESDFFVMGATGNVYTVTLSTTPSCSCPDRTTPCKHILFVFIRVLGLPLDDACLRRRTLRPCQLNRLLTTPTTAETLAGDGVREVFHRLYFQRAREVAVRREEVEREEGATCPVCLDEMGRGEKVVACGTCRNPIHEECLLRWKRTTRRRTASCVICRARWRNIANQETYLNLSAYVSSDDDMADQGRNSSSLCGG
ncbi:uncharacterized protein LOC131333113 [Rhododendron vialii]|uniref:uncharacterized protein LOC131333113 n=1 Tax=Rhododendron vialii TaxID=182163 RepID=UPI00265E7D2A|nr:uncharacterized protein LOC131333113 [Rhododendron vialii]